MPPRRVLRLRTSDNAIELILTPLDHIGLLVGIESAVPRDF